MAFQLEKQETDSSALRSYKWAIGNSKYEITSVRYLDSSMELNEVIPHCLDIKEKVLSTVATEAHKGVSLFKITPSTMSITNRADSFADAKKMQWQLDSEEQPEEPSSVDNYDAIVKKFIASLATEDAQQDLKEFTLKKAKKPRSMSVPLFFYRLKVLNSYVSWLPGSEEPLDNEHLKKALHDGMPQKWQERVLTAGVNYRKQTVPFLTQYFRNLEQLANKKERDNITLQRRERDRTRKQKLAGNPPGTRDKKRGREGEDKYTKKDAEGKVARIADDALCHIHKGSKHTSWFERFANKFGKLKDGSKPDRNGKKPDKANPKTKNKALAATCAKKR